MQYHELQQLEAYLPRIKTFKEALMANEVQINQTTLVLARRDLHFGNVMWDPAAKRSLGFWTGSLLLLCLHSAGTHPMLSCMILIRHGLTKERMRDSR